MAINALLDNIYLLDIDWKTIWTISIWEAMIEGLTSNIKELVREISIQKTKSFDLYQN
jgi:hypothetical protein